MINFKVLYESTKSRNRITAKNLYSSSSHPLSCKYPNIIPSFVHVFLILIFLICLFWDCTLIFSLSWKCKCKAKLFYWYYTEVFRFTSHNHLPVMSFHLLQWFSMTSITYFYLSNIKLMYWGTTSWITVCFDFFTSRRGHCCVHPSKLGVCSSTQALPPRKNTPGWKRLKIYINQGNSKNRWQMNDKIFQRP